MFCGWTEGSKSANSCASESLRSSTTSSFSSGTGCYVLLSFDTSGGIIAGCGHGTKYGRKNRPGICIQGWLDPLPADVPLGVRLAAPSPTDIPLGVRNGGTQGFIILNFCNNWAFLTGSWRIRSMSPSLQRIYRITLFFAAVRHYCKVLTYTCCAAKGKSGYACVRSIYWRASLLKNYLRLWLFI